MKPPPSLLISEWADKYAILTAETSAEPGKWLSYPYQIAMMDAFCNAEVETVTIKKSARIGYTKILGHVIGYHIHQDPCSLLVVQPTIEDAQGYSKEELQPTIDETPVLAGRVAEKKSKSSGNTMLKKSYQGGFIHLVGANSARGFRRITCKIALFDEVNGYPPTAGLEGDQIKLGTKRTETFYDRKIGIGSTPTVHGASRVSASFEKSSKGYYFLSCPDCGGEHIRMFREPKEPIILNGEKIKMSCLQWVDKDPSTAAWNCPDCGSLIDYSHHHKMISHGRWIGEHWEWSKETGFIFNPSFDGHIGFWIWAGYSYSPNSTPAKLAREFLDCEGDTESKRTYWNTVLGLDWEEEGEAANEHSLLARVSEYDSEVPQPAQVLTAGVDIQDDRIEVEVTGWAEDQTSWNIDYIILPGSTSLPDVWEALEDALLGSYQKNINDIDESIGIHAICIDSGFRAQAVYSFCERFAKKHNPKIWPTKGMKDPGRPIVEPISARLRRLRRRKSKTIRPELIGTHEAKLLLMRRLKLTDPQKPGYCHFPIDRDQEYFAQLTAEKLVTRYVQTRPISEWHLVRQRNEALDCRVLSHAALLLANPKFDELHKLSTSKQNPHQKQMPVNQEPQNIPRRRLIR